ncbi:molybdopterin molybdenumtransferase MoeA [Xaviernesmea oryzae]|uniref:Molybdopterin molybdenumtransferase n=1 Tax=Xaviernesmea oryzae TaxID=464029 RepID=A0A1Q9AWI8_9HYPH|nr:gephyrin-like molybdotransferase Glp [Xaviernesmea oryzae]OLP59822.1 molybdopterin molybdenumtransferase MoeA [Xaviernesmea oryzae]SEK50320.1 molybdopterin molybdotransferase [Xaviernesmea oryzae]
MALLPVNEALARLLDPAQPIARHIDLPLSEAQGLVLAEDISAKVTFPAFDNSAMDGYALRHEDIAEGETELTVIGQSAAGHGFSGRVGPFQAVRIFTGAPLPDGADTVLMQEDAEVLDGHRIRTRFTPIKGRHIRPRGQDFAEGETLLFAGERLDAGRLTLAAGMNCPTLPVFARPRVAIISTGDELVPPGAIPGADQIVASNGFGVAALVRENGGEVIDLGLVPDLAEAIAEAVGRARRAGADVLVTLGGASVGDHDLVQSSLVSLGMELDFWKIAMRPGKPLMVGRLDAMHVLGLPGNPVSSLVCALLFLEPLVARLARRDPPSRAGEAVLAEALPANDTRQDYIRARLVRQDDGRLMAYAFPRQDSSMMRVFAASDALIVRPVAAPALEAGSPCPILLLRPV